MNRISYFIQQLSSKVNYIRYGYKQKASVTIVGGSMTGLLTARALMVTKPNDTAQTSKAKLRIAIIGGSMSGLFAARALQSLGHDIHIFERRTDYMTGGGITVTYPLMEFMNKYKVFNSPKDKDKNLVPTITTSTIDNNSNLKQKIHPETVRRHTSWDCLYYNLLNPSLASQYTPGKKLKNITLNNNDSSEHLMEISFEDNSTFSCDLIIGADGVGSKVRNFVSNNKENKMEYSGYVSWRGVVNSSDIDKNDSLYCWVNEHSWVLYHGENTQFLNYIVPQYNTSEMLYNWVWYIKYTPDELKDAPFLVDIDGKNRPYSMPRGLLCDNGVAHVSKEADRLLEKTCNRLVKMTKQPFYQVIYDYKVNAMSEYFRSNDNKKEGGIVLIGDAAFTIRPHITKATSKASGDAMCLEKYLGMLGNGMCLEDVLKKYNDERIVEGNDLLNKARDLGNKVVLQTGKREFNQEYVRSSKGD